MNTSTELPAKDQAALSAILMKVDPPHRITWLIENWKQFNPPKQRYLLMKMWTTSEPPGTSKSPHNASLVSMFREVGFISDSETPDFPNPLTVYRGCLVPQHRSMAWTTNIKIAREFAAGKHLPRIQTGYGLILTAQCPKSGLLGYCTGRGDFEVIVDPGKLKLDRLPKIIRRRIDKNIKPDAAERAVAKIAREIARSYRIEIQVAELNRKYG